MRHLKIKMSCNVILCSWLHHINYVFHIKMVLNPQIVIFFGQHRTISRNLRRTKQLYYLCQPSMIHKYIYKHLHHKLS